MRLVSVSVAAFGFALLGFVLLPNLSSDTPPASDPSSPFLGSWVTTDIRFYGDAATMVIEPSEDQSVEVIAHNLATPCVPAPTTMIGTGRLRAENELVIPAPVFTCDDGSQPDPEFLEMGLTEFSEQFQNLTFTRDTETDILTDNFGGVWVREGAEDRGSESTTPHSETEITDLLNGFLEARIAGEGAQQYLNAPAEDIPLLYATTSGASYERAEFEEVSGIEWPYGDKAFKVRLFAGDTVVEQIFTIGPAGRLGLGYPGSFGTGGDLAPTTEDGQPLAVPYNLFDGEVTLHIAYPWVSFGSDGSIRLIPAGEGPTTDGGQRHHWLHLLLMADPSPAGTHCVTGSGPADAEALAESIRSDPDLDATAPVMISGGGAEGLMMDLVGTGAYFHPCNGDPGRGPVLSFEDRVRLYLFDAPEGASMRILAIAFDVPESDFERAVEATAPIAVEFHAP
jgi:hypothetical protein